MPRAFSRTCSRSSRFGSRTGSYFTDMSRAGNDPGLLFKHMVYHVALTHSNWENGDGLVLPRASSLSVRA